MDKNVREKLELGNAYICEPHYKKDDIKFTIKPQNNFLYFCHAYCFGQNPGAWLKLSPSSFYGLLPDY